MWAVCFRENETVIRYINKVAVVANDSPKFRSEKQFMESDKIAFFTKCKDAHNWLNQFF